VTNTDGFWIGFIDTAITITLNLQSHITANNQ
jgi:hypothetical protein